MFFTLLFIIVSAIALVRAFDVEWTRTRLVTQRGTVGAVSLLVGCAITMVLAGNVSKAYADEVIETVVVESEQSESAARALPPEPAKQGNLPAVAAAENAESVAVEVVDDEAPSQVLPLVAEEIAAQVHIPDGRPAWVEADRIFHGERGNQTAVSSDPHALKHDATEALEEHLNIALCEYVNDYLRNDRAALLVGHFGHDLSYFENNFITQRYDEVIQVSFGPMHQRHALLEFNDAFRTDLDEQWHRLQAASRLSTAGLGAFAVICLIGVLFSYLRFDRATRGYYTGRLQLLAAVAILVLVGLGVVVADNWIPWI